MRAPRLLLLLWALLVPTPAVSTIYLVRPDGTGDFPTIQHAIDAAMDGDTIALGNGTFTGVANRDLDYQGKALTVQSLDGNPELCIIDCQGISRAVFFHGGEGPGSVLKDICIRNGTSPWEGEGAGVLCEGGASPLIDGCWFDRNIAAGSGGGLASRNGSAARVVRCRFTGNTAAVCGGGLYQGASSVSTTIDGCEFTGNSGSLDSGGAYLAGGVDTLRDCSFSGNRSNGYVGRGAAIYGANGDITLERCMFTDNYSGDGELNFGGAISLLTCTFHFTDCTFERNRSRQGGALYCQGGCSGTVDNCTFSRNTARYGAGISLSGSSATVNNTIIAFSMLGAGVQGAAALYCCDFYGNASGDPPGGANGNMNADPLFCRSAGSDTLSLQPTSPCAPGTPPNGSCGQIGARGVGCEATSGPCCIGEVCVVLDADVCAALLGVYKGTGGFCEPDPYICLPAAVEEVRRPSGILRSAPAPNPTKGAVRCVLGGDAAGVVDVVLLEVTGRVIRNEKWWARPGGDLQMAFRMVDGGGSTLPTGTYFLRLTAGTRRETFRLCVVR